MMTITIKNGYGEPRVYENIVGVDFIDKENCENAAGRELSNEELERIERAIGQCEHFPTQFDLQQIINELE